MSSYAWFMRGQIDVIFFQGSFLLSLSFVFEIGSHTAQASLELDTQPR